VDKSRTADQALGFIFLSAFPFFQPSFNANAAKLMNTMLMGDNIETQPTTRFTIVLNSKEKIACSSQ